MAPKHETNGQWPEQLEPTKLRRTQSSSTESEPKGFVTITRLEYEKLLQKACEYSNLRQALISGGADLATLETLARGSNVQEAAGQEDSHGMPQTHQRTSTLSTKRTTSPYSSRQPTVSQNLSSPSSRQHFVSKKFSADAEPFYPKAAGNWRQRRESLSTSGDVDCSSASRDEEGLVDDGIFSEKGHRQRSFEPKGYDDRGLIFKGLSDRTTLKDIAKVVRGGAVLNMYFRPRDRIAHVVFVEPHAADAFYTYSRRKDLYVLGKRIEVFHDDKPYYIAGHVAHRIHSQAATRNLVIVNARADMTDASIRDDLEHIFRLEVVDIITHKGDIFVSLNSVPLAITAKACMASRLRYKYSKIDFFEDECAQDLPASRPLPKAPRSPAPHVKDTSSAVNRFEMLSFDDSGSSDDEPSHQMPNHASRERSLEFSGQAIAV